jgi:hypothetical protein
MVCGRVTRRLTVSHIEKHGLTLAQYQERHGSVLIPLRAMPGNKKQFVDLDELALSGKVEFRNLTLYQVERMERVIG